MAVSSRYRARASALSDCWRVRRTSVLIERMRSQASNGEGTCRALDVSLTLGEEGRSEREREAREKGTHSAVSVLEEADLGQDGRVAGR